jgi:hypothetical protein
MPTGFMSLAEAAAKFAYAASVTSRVETAVRILRAKYSRDAQGVHIEFDGGRAKARLDGDWLRGVIWDSLGETMSVTLIR